ncbi:DUF1801 domain-containing protein [Sphingobacterium sp. DK4209]|uniref:DUF1801 domain-containing protein n=1 Tax=Sphingobacterium zhuxiongii TaxID=2662364 RepID=A0A5Q0QFV3_9SPHI|nr:MULTISPECIES: DUF1801 domain-containing protein [unclassified Sphingobacterium]MVZ65153.1 DUF1801 domain-containing protein [Sphingobacterium sp. DK4209]QGA26100.1 DUF1801 domain-containing protein [Sphingobacterium sp. dk4302]
MAKVKTTFTNDDVTDFLALVDNEQKRQDSYELIKLMEEATGERAKMFGPSIIGFGRYHYKYDSGHEGDAPLLGFSPRKAAISLYVYSGGQQQDELLKSLGKFKMGKACIYVKKLTDINLDTLQKMMTDSIKFTSEKYQRI